MDDLIDLARWPLDDLSSPRGKEMIAACQEEIMQIGMTNLVGFLRPEAIAKMVQEVTPVLASDSYTHARKHNVYFKKNVDGVPADHPVLMEFETSNQTICADQFAHSAILRLYEWPAFRNFLAVIMEMGELYVMADPLARVNVMSYSKGQALNWHFDRSEFTTTLLLQAPDQGGAFQYSKDLRSDDKPNYAGVVRLLQGEDENLKTLVPEAGTLNVFRGKNTIHRVTTVDGKTDRLIAVFSYFDRPGVMFTPEERQGFYGRAG